MVLGRLVMEFVVAGIEDEKVGRLKAMVIGELVGGAGLVREMGEGEECELGAQKNKRKMEETKKCVLGKGFCLCSPNPQY